LPRGGQTGEGASVAVAKVVIARMFCSIVKMLLREIVRLCRKNLYCLPSSPRPAMVTPVPPRALSRLIHPLAASQPLRQGQEGKGEGRLRPEWQLLVRGCLLWRSSRLFDRFCFSPRTSVR
jgi:hypothetical protein